MTPNQRHGDAWACVIKGAVVEKPLGEVQVSEAAALDCVSQALTRQELVIEVNI